MDTYRWFAPCIVIDQLNSSLHQLEIEIRKYACKSMEEWCCQLCHRGGSDEHYVCNCVLFSDITGRYYCLFNQGTDPLRKVTEYKDQERLGLFLIELKRYKQVVEGQSYNHNRSSTGNKQNFLSLHYSSSFKSIKDYTSGVSTNILKKGCNSNIPCK